MARPLSNRAELLLGLVREGSDPETGHVWIPRTTGAHRIYGEDQGSYGFTPGGAGDAVILKSLERRGFISPNSLTSYAYIVTYSGIAEYDRVAARRRGDRKAV
jgi:hypothetical protein